jgi:hypothetical protein
MSCSICSASWNIMKDKGSLRILRYSVGHSPAGTRRYRENIQLGKPKLEPGISIKIREKFEFANSAWARTNMSEVYMLCASVWRRTTGWTAGCRYPQMSYTFLFSTASWQALESIQPPIQWVARSRSSRVKRPELHLDSPIRIHGFVLK